MLSKDKALYLQLYEKMLLIRHCEDKLEELFAAGQVHGTTHLYVGEEAVAAGVCCALSKQDVIFSTHRGHGHSIAKGTDVAAMMAEFLGRETGCCKGRGGSMHVADIENGNYGTNGIVGGGIPLAVGAALAIKMRGEERMVVCFFGDGASNQGTFHEAVNLASIWKLPVLFVCEDNQYGLSMSKSRSMNIDDISVRAKSYGIHADTVDGNDAAAVYHKTLEATAYVRQNGPMLLVCDTYRISGHSKSDRNAYRTQDEIEHWKQKDPIARFRSAMLKDAILSEAQLSDIESRAASTIEKAVAFAQSSAFPKDDDVSSGVYA